MGIDRVVDDCIQQKELAAGVKLFIVDNGEEVARAYLYVLRNDLHDKPFGMMEDVFVKEAYRFKGYGVKILDALIQEARARGCYKLVGTSRFEREHVHKFYKRIGFKQHGIEFRMDFS